MGCRVKSLLTWLCVFAVLFVCVPILGCGGDKTVEDRKSDYNQEMEDAMRNSDTVRQKREEFEEEEAAIQQMQEGGGGQENQGE